MGQIGGSPVGNAPNTASRCRAKGCLLTNDLIPIPDDFESCVQHALDQNDKTREFIAGALQHGIDRVYLVGCGGSHFGTYPAFDLLDRYTDEVTTQRISSAELTRRNPTGLGERALVVAASHSGNTPETLEAAQFAKSKGATVIGISRQGENGLSTVGDLHLDYPDTISITEPKLVLNEQVAIALLDGLGVTQKATDLAASLPALPAALKAVKEEVAETGERIADLLADAPFNYIVGAGPAYGMAKMMSWCYFMEMQWMHSAAINGADFFHGPLEMAAETHPLINILAEDQSREMGERVNRFGERYAKHFAKLDTADFSLPGISAEARPDLSVIALMSAERRVLDHVAARRGHDTSQRRYMYKVEY